ncbi:GtrA family protein [Phenylobacterium sp.]|uniref:GtrA family protein n=1 Tax=Phenylobacterium sp. TaxID=1871053 RepID=UPI0025D4A636|nr:GtrA family protein [Phenylobacterium sp.]MBX3484344.1 GtrA family protein [Phenylobacterium sp.]MCW5759347.1 GtrA family protein [Phenylobacterium sp.]
MPAPDLKREAGTVARFGLAGLANTGFGLAVILGLELGLGVERHLANAAGYAAGALLGFVLNRRFVFTGPASERGLKTRYLLTLAVAFAVNQGVLTAGAAILPAGDLGRTVAQLCALGSYTVTQFLLMRLWVFRARS